MFKKKVTQKKVVAHLNNSIQVIKEETVYYFLFIPIFRSSIEVDLQE